VRFSKGLAWGRYEVVYAMIFAFWQELYFDKEKDGGKQAGTRDRRKHRLCV